MNLPKIDLSALPDFHALTGVFGSLTDAIRGQSMDDSLIALMTFVYDTWPPSSGTNGLF